MPLSFISKYKNPSCFARQNLDFFEIKFLLIFMLILSGCSVTLLNKKDEKEFEKWHHRFHEYKQEPHEWYPKPNN